MSILPHTETWVDLASLGARRPYAPSYAEMHLIRPRLEHLLAAPVKPGTSLIEFGIPGALRREDAAKLYELAYFAPGDLLELGCGRGLATAIMAQAIHDAGRASHVVAIDHNPEMIEETRANLAAFALLDRAYLLAADALAVCQALIAQRQTFAAVFVDHSPRYQDVRDVSLLLDQIVAADGFALFHDFNDRRNKAKDESAYRVYDGVLRGLPMPPFTFHGVFGCTGVFQRPQESAAARADQPAPAAALSA